jgi:GTP-binding protein
VFNIKARGAMQIAVLVETMRREGYEVLVSRPTVITKLVDGHTHEPYETLWVETPEECLGAVIQNLANRKGQIVNMEKHSASTMLEVTITTRGLIGFEIDLVNVTSGRGVMSHLFKEYGPHAGEIKTRITGTLIATDAGIATAYALDALGDRGRMFVGPGEECYTGMIVGENPRVEDMPINPTKEKHLSNVRSQGEGKGIQLAPPVKMSLERAIEYIAADEYVEVTPKYIRLRKRILDPNKRKRAANAEK